MSSANLMRGQDSSLCLPSAVYSVNKKGERTVPCRAPVLVYSTSDLIKGSDEEEEATGDLIKWGRNFMLSKIHEIK